MVHFYEINHKPIVWPMSRIVHLYGNISCIKFWPSDAKLKNNVKRLVKRLTDGVLKEDHVIEVELNTVVCPLYWIKMKWACKVLFCGELASCVRVTVMHAIVQTSRDRVSLLRVHQSIDLSIVQPATSTVNFFFWFQYKNCPQKFALRQECPHDKSSILPSFGTAQLASVEEKATTLVVIIAGGTDLQATIFYCHIAHSMATVLVDVLSLAQVFWFIVNFPGVYIFF